MMFSLNIVDYSMFFLPLGGPHDFSVSQVPLGLIWVLNWVWPKGLGTGLDKKCWPENLYTTGWRTTKSDYQIELWADHNSCFLEEVNSIWESHSDSISSFHLSVIERWAIINALNLHEKSQHLFTLKNCCSTHHRGLVRFRISDRKFVIHTTEMILWSMILIIVGPKSFNIFHTNVVLLKRNQPLTNYFFTRLQNPNYFSKDSAV